MLRSISTRNKVSRRLPPTIQLVMGSTWNQPGNHKFNHKSPPVLFDAGGMGRGHKNNQRPTPDRNNTSLVRSIEDISVRHGRRLRRWLSTWDSVDHSLMVRLSSHIRESHEASRLVPEMIPLFDELQHSSEMDITSAVERIEHIINMCQRAGSTDQSKDT